jgi:hypothetical protein
MTTPANSLQRSLRHLCAAAGITIMMACVPAAQAQTPPAASSPASETIVLNEATMTMMVQSTIAALNHANLTNDYSILIKLGSQDFQRNASNQRLSESFHSLRDNGIDMGGGLVAPLRWAATPVFQDGMLHLTGSLATRPQEIRFNLGYTLEQGRWRLQALSVEIAMPRS